MRNKLPPSLAGALEIHAEVSGPMLHRKVLELGEYFNTEFEMTFPPLNFPFLIYKHMKDLGLPGKYNPVMGYTNNLITLSSRDIPRSSPIGLTTGV
jgi:RNA polymerase I-specific transcription initiation factor RRN7